MVPSSEAIAVDYQQGYIRLIKEEDVVDALKKNTKQFTKLLKKISTKKSDHAYAEGKWTIREVLQHIIDAERVFTYRALRLSRADATPLPGFDENTWAAHAGAAGRKWEDLLGEFKAVRKSTEYLFASFTDDQLRFTGQVNGAPLNTIALGFLIPGHVAHHIRILKERYL